MKPPPNEPLGCFAKPPPKPNTPGVFWKTTLPNETPGAICETIIPQTETPNTKIPLVFYEHTSMWCFAKPSPQIKAPCYFTKPASQWNTNRGDSWNHLQNGTSQGCFAKLPPNKTPPPNETSPGKIKYLDTAYADRPGSVVNGINLHGQWVLSGEP